jgi:hypothetical protein
VVEIDQVTCGAFAAPFCLNADPLRGKKENWPRRKSQPLRQSWC